MAMATRILLVEDELDLARSVVYALQRDGFEMSHAASGRAALDLCRNEAPFDVVLLDLMLPDLSGIEVCRQLRAEPRTRGLRILMLTARAEEIDRVVGFEVGADDYLVKPFSVRELALRIRALLRGVHEQAAEGLLTAGPLRVDTTAHRCWNSGQVVALSGIELRLLTHLMQQRGRVLGRTQLLDAVWKGEAEISDRTVDVTVKRLREKLGDAGNWVETLRGVGYRFAEHAPAGQA